MIVFNNINAHYFALILNEYYNLKIGVICKDKDDFLPDFISFFCFVDESDDLILDKDGINDYSEIINILEKDEKLYVMKCGGEFIRNLQKNNILPEISLLEKRELIQKINVFLVQKNIIL